MFFDRLSAAAFTEVNRQKIMKMILVKVTFQDQFGFTKYRLRYLLVDRRSKKHEDDLSES